MSFIQPFPESGPLFIPVSGPAPYNTLVVVQGNYGGEPLIFPIDGNLDLAQAVWSTTFLLPGFDPRVGPPPYEHSTMAWLTELEANDVAGFTFAINDIPTAYFDATGRWTVTLDAASRGDWDIDAMTYALPQGSLFVAAVSSWILCWLPPPPPGAPTESSQLLLPAVKTKAPSRRVSRGPGSTLRARPAGRRRVR